MSSSSKMTSGPLMRSAANSPGAQLVKLQALRRAGHGEAPGDGGDTRGFGAASRTRTSYLPRTKGPLCQMS